MRRGDLVRTETRSAHARRSAHCHQSTQIQAIPNRGTIGQRLRFQVLRTKSKVLFSLANPRYVTELTKKIRTKSSDGYCEENENAAEFVRFFPDFVWTVRDLTLQMMINGRPITDDEYLESALKLQQGESGANPSRWSTTAFHPTQELVDPWAYTVDRPTCSFGFT